MGTIEEDKMNNAKKHAYELYEYIYSIDVINRLIEKFNCEIDYDTAEQLAVKFDKKQKKKFARAVKINKIPLIRSIYHFIMGFKAASLKDGDIAHFCLAMMDALGVDNLTVEDIDSALRDKEVYNRYFKDDFEFLQFNSGATFDDTKMFNI